MQYFKSVYEYIGISRNVLPIPFKLTLRRNYQETLSSGEICNRVILAQCYFVDLAGSERLEMSGNRTVNIFLIKIEQRRF